MSSEGKVIVLSVLLVENGIEQRRKLRKKLETGTKPTKEAESDLWSEKRAGELEKAIPNAVGFFAYGK